MIYCGIVDPFVSGQYLAQTLQVHGIRPLALITDPVQAKNLEDKQRFRSEEFFQVIPIAHLNDDQVEQQLKAFKPCIIIPGSEYACALADRLATRLSPQFANPPCSSSWRFNKMAMQDVIGKAGIPNVASQAITHLTSQTQLTQLLENWQWPTVVKPTETGGSFGVKICHTAQEITQQLKQLQHAKYPLAQEPVQTVLLQEFLEGEEYFIDTCSYQNQHRLVSLGYYKKVFQNGLPVYRYIELRDFDNEKGQILSDYLKQILNAVELYNGLSHTEIMLTSKGPRLIEVNPRISGVYGLVNALASKVYHTDQVTLLAQAIKHPTDFLASVNTFPKFHQHGRLVFLHCVENRPIRKLNYSLLNQLASYNGHLTLKKAGDLVSGQSTLAETVVLVQLLHTDHEVIAANTEQLFQYEQKGELF